MTNQLKVGVMSTLVALALSACSTAPVEEMDTNAVASIPESGPLVQGNNTTVATTPARPQQPNTQAHYQPDYDANTYVPAPAYTPAQPQYQTETQGYADESTTYEETTPVANYGTNTTSGSVGGGVDSSYDMYDNYGRPKAQPKPLYDYSGSEGYPDVYAGGGAAVGGSIGSSGGSHAVQVLASGSSSKAQQMRSQMQSLGLNAVVDNVGGLYKVRIPFASRDQASANLGRIRSLSGESGAFITTR